MSLSSPDISSKFCIDISSCRLDLANLHEYLKWRFLKQVETPDFYITAFPSIKKEFYIFPTSVNGVTQFF